MACVGIRGQGSAKSATLAQWHSLSPSTEPVREALGFPLKLVSDHNRDLPPIGQGGGSGNTKVGL